MKQPRTRPDWFKPERPEYRDSALLYACANAGLTAEEALDEMAKREAALLKQLVEMGKWSTRPILVKPWEESGT